MAPRQRLVVAVGGEGGPCVLKEGRGGGKGGGRGGEAARGDDDFELSDEELGAMVLGRPAQETTLQLMLRRFKLTARRLSIDHP